jgi:site-specific DNA-cytosine methylase
VKYLSLFSGIGGFELAIQSVFPNAECVGFSEIDKYAITTYQKHFPDHVNLGDIQEINSLALPDFDMIVGGFPCQDLSIAKSGRQGLNGKRSGLFWTMVSIMRIKSPKWFCIENVASMPKEAKALITRELGVEPIIINAALVSGQNRKRLFWCNWNVSQPEDRYILLKDILESGEELKLGNRPKGKSYCITASYWKSENLKHHEKHHQRQLVIDNGIIRKLTPTECERLQCFSDNWTDTVSNTQRYKQLGNAVNVEVVKHIMNELKQEEEK